MEDAVKDASADIQEIRGFYDKMKDYYFKKPAGIKLECGSICKR